MRQVFTAIGGYDEEGGENLSQFHWEKGESLAM